MHVRSIEGEERVTPLELFFDLVFVFALTQVTGFLAANESPEGLLRGTLLFTALWWAWEAYAWLTNTLDPEEGAVRLAVFATTGAMLIVALATPSAFGQEALVFGVAYFVVRVLHLGRQRLPIHGPAECADDRATDGCRDQKARYVRAVNR